MLTKSKQFCLTLKTPTANPILKIYLENFSSFHTLTNRQPRKRPHTCGRHIFFNLTFIGFESKSIVGKLKKSKQSYDMKHLPQCKL